MAPSHTKKRNSTIEDESSAHSPTVSPRLFTTTPTRNPQKAAIGITQAQKQALIDNLQLEITERARKLRAQYALQAQSLRTRIELRINRIPTSLRKANMGELFEKYKVASKLEEKTTSEGPVPAESNSGAVSAQKSAVKSNAGQAMPAPVSQGAKRKSDAMEAIGKENVTDSTEDIPNPKKRSKVAQGPSRQVTNPSTVLSPKSANSRTLPQSPIRPIVGSSQKSYLSHPASPLKLISPVKISLQAKAAAAAATTNLAVIVGEKPKTRRPKAGANLKATNPTAGTKGAGGRAKRGANLDQESQDVRKVSNTSSISSASNATTIVKNAKKVPTAAIRGNAVGGRAVGKKVAAAVEAPPVGRRVLRKRA